MRRVTDKVVIADESPPSYYNYGNYAILSSDRFLLSCGSKNLNDLYTVRLGFYSVGRKGPVKLRLKRRDRSKCGKMTDNETKLICKFKIIRFSGSKFSV